MNKRTWRGKEIEAVPRERAATSTVEAIMFTLRTGVAALEREWIKVRLPLLDEDQLRRVCERVQKFEPKIAQPWTDEQTGELIAAWRATC